jgi:hypothetical protein
VAPPSGRPCARRQGRGRSAAGRAHVAAAGPPPESSGQAAAAPCTRLASRPGQRAALLG